MAIRIELPLGAWEQVCNQADREWRTPKQQAEYLILRSLGWEWPRADDAPDSTTPTPPTKTRATRVASASKGSAS